MREQEVRALCREDPELFFPVGSSGPAVSQEREAKKVCYRCPLLQKCRKFALEEKELWGVWGGLGEEERKALIQDRGKRDAA